MSEPTLSEMHKHYAEALRTINRQREELDLLKKAMLTYLRDLRTASGDLSRNVYLSKTERELLDKTIKALETKPCE